MKPESMGDPDIYLGCNKLRKQTLTNGVEAWLQSPSKYSQEAVKNGEVYFKSKYNLQLTKKVTSPFPAGYQPELDVTDALVDEEEAAYYQSQIGILRRIVEIGRVDIVTEVSLLASQLALPRKGHLFQVFRIFCYLLKSRHSGCLVFDTSYPEIDLSHCTSTTVRSGRTSLGT
jgi:hypothetical protein